MGSAVILRILTFYVLSVFLIVSVAPWNTVRSGVSPFTLALDTMHVPWAGTIMTVIILTAVLSCLNSAFYVSSRVLFILAGVGLRKVGDTMSGRPGDDKDGPRVTKAAANSKGEFQ